VLEATEPRPWRGLGVKRKALVPRQAEAAGANTLMMTGNPDRIIEFDGAGRTYLSKPFPPEAFVQRVQELVAAE
jgi:DNA-binding response OmpR family regulator